jgi:hypothetical protein
MAMETLREISNKFAKKQPQQVEYLIEESPILEACKWTAASHNLWNAAEKVEDITGPGYVKMNDELPVVGVSTGMEKIDLNILGGEMEVPEDTAKMHGGAMAYFAKKQPLVLKKAGNDTELKLFQDNWRQYAIDNKNVIDAGGTGVGLNTILCVRFDEAANVGLYNPNQFKQGALLEIAFISNGALMRLKHAPYTGVNGFGMQMKAHFGWQMLNPKTICAIVNVRDGKIPTEIMMDDMVTGARGSNRNTYIFCHPRAQTHFINPLKTGKMHTVVQDKALDTTVESWNGIPVVTSYNLLWNGESQV